VSTASLIVGVAAANSDRSAVLVSGIAGLVAGAMSMAAGEYVSVSSQADTDQADLAREARELAASPASEIEELAGIYAARGLDRELSVKVAEQLMAFDALKSHARDELGISERGAARPLQASLASASTFSLGAALPLAVALLAPNQILGWSVSIGAVVALMGLGALAAAAGGANRMRGALRVGFWGIFALAVTAGAGKLFGAALG
jgi:VIT1/CCC1 family predicted Fe2+/Mn2+ transporter